MLAQVLPGRSLRYAGLSIVILITLLALMPHFTDNYPKALKLGTWKHLLSKSSNSEEVVVVPDLDEILERPEAPTIRKANATFVILARNSELTGVMSSVRQIEAKFNHKFKYPYVFLNDEEFTPQFKRFTSQVISSTAEYGLIPKSDWKQPEWIDEMRAASYRKYLSDRGIIYGDSVPYRNMCRFNSGFFYRQELLQKYEWYWRVEPNVDFFCDIPYDPFLWMEDNNKLYGFTIALQEFGETIPTLWSETQSFMKSHPEHVAANNSLEFVSMDNGISYNMCHYWSNFEIASLKFWRGPAYTDYFDHLEKAGGFYYERWGDAPVHSLAVSLFADQDQVHFFDDIGYGHAPFRHCPTGKMHAERNCTCQQWENFDYQGYSCLPRWKMVYQKAGLL